MIELHPDTKHIFIWVPGTGGHEPHPAFVKAVEEVCQEPYQILYVAYPAQWRLQQSVEAGIKATKAMIDEISPLIDREIHKIYMGGSSQGSWVLDEVLADTVYRYFPHKAVIFGHPGTDATHSHENKFDGDDTVWEINDPKDTVTFGWDGKEQEIVEAFTKAQSGDISSILKILGLAITRPVRLFKLLFLAAHHVGLIPWSNSPHDYSNQMPLAVYWMLH